MVPGLANPELVPLAIPLVHVAPRAHLASRAQVALELYLGSSRNYLGVHNILYTPQGMLSKDVYLDYSNGG